jgi:hypothetical protein
MMENPHLEFLPPGARNDPSAEFPPLLYILNHTSGREYWVYEINESGADISSQEWAISGMGTLTELHGNGGITALADYRLGEFESSIPEL